MKVKYGNVGGWDVFINVDEEIAKLLGLKEKASTPKPRRKTPTVNGKRIKRVIYNDPATIIIWDDESKTVAKAEDGDKYDKEKGFYICLLKELLGNKKTLALINEHWNEWHDDQLTIKDLNF